MSSTASGATPNYFVPQPSRHPAMASFGLLCIIFGAAMWINGESPFKFLVLFGFLWLFAILFQWFRDAIRESEGHQYGAQVDRSFRWSMSWFIFSEVMFFGAFFTALWWMRAHSVPALGGLDNAVLWPDFKGVWPSVSPGATASPADIIEPFQVMTPLWLPTINTALLLSSGVTITIAHHLLRENRRVPTIFWMWCTVALGFTFLCVQGYEYFHAYHEMNLKLSSGAYGSTFFMLTGFHGFHVFVGMLMLFFITLRLMKGHFTPERHFGFEGAAWYWHFVDVVWLGLYTLVYWL
ncbi:MAG TPA: cytochrome c oxidase subunit 3 [Ramlibacter sp.]|uniref:cytochrome c oxidase subunit 3 n=1 Tax=Ramlibacter sp. TaxID=1917967 RepID=UPI002B57F5F7|nr:cytochrome c oxidase subunit 3 [Ramlibacter sp.]HVZ44543.1 cytochrome c oxidase subunit 3 [Ramlibacter sp.]